MTDENINNEDVKSQMIFNKPPIIHFQKPQPDIQESEITAEQLEQQPDEIIPISEPSLEIIPTAHISDESVKSVREIIHEKRPEIVAIELDFARYRSLMDQKNGVQREAEFNLKETLKSSNLIVTIVTALLSHMQAKMGEEVGVKPGSEMMEAIEIAKEVNADVALIDRGLQTTLKRTINAMTFREKISFGWEILKSLFIMDDADEEEFREEIEELKQDDMIQEAMGYFKEATPGGYYALVHERDAYMAYYLKSLEDKNVVAVVGAGHKSGIKEYLENPETIPPIAEIDHVKESKYSITQIILALIPIIFVLLFIGAYINGVNIQGGIINYLIFAGGGAFLGSILSGSKIQSALVGLIAAPITVLHPLLAAGWFSGIAEGKLRHVSMHDLTAFPSCESFKELWQNKLFRVIIVVLGTNIGTTIGFLLSVNDVLMPYLHAILGI